MLNASRCVIPGVLIFLSSLQARHALTVGIICLRAHVKHYGGRLFGRCTCINWADPELSLARRFSGGSKSFAIWSTTTSVNAATLGTVTPHIALEKACCTGGVV